MVFLGDYALKSLVLDSLGERWECGLSQAKMAQATAPRREGSAPAKLLNSLMNTMAMIFRTLGRRSIRIPKGREKFWKGESPVSRSDATDGSTTSTDTRRRYPRRPTVSMYVGL